MGQSLKLENAPGKTSQIRVPLVVRVKNAREVIVTGDFTGWTMEGVSLRKGPSGEWRTLLNLPAGEHQYRLIVDGEWRDDPQAKERVANPYGGENCILRVPPGPRLDG